jgi:acetylcholinesterase
MDSYIAAGLGVPHTIDSEAIFGVGNVNDYTNAEAQPGYNTYNAEIIPVVMNHYISFIRHLDPNKYKYKGAPKWESFGDRKSGGKRLMFQTNATQDQEARCEF